MTTQGQDMFYAQSRPQYAQTIIHRCGGKELFGTEEVAGIFDKSIELVRIWIEEGRLAAVDTNAGRVRDGRPVRAHYTITRQAIIDLAERIEKGQ